MRQSHHSTMSFLGKQESIPLSLRAPLWVRGNPYLSLQARIYQGVAISSSYIGIVQYSLFFRYKNYKKTIFFINITIYLLYK